MRKKSTLNIRKTSMFRKPRIIMAAAGMALVGTAAVLFANAATANYYVSPTGSDANDGTSAAAPFKTIQKALDTVTAGATINLAAGTYRETLTTKTDGAKDNPITILGPETGKDVAGRYKAILNTPGGKHGIDVNNSYYTFKGFTVDGQEKIARSEYPTTYDQTRSFKDSVQDRAVNSKLLYIGAADTTHDITGVRIDDMFLNGSGGECVRLRNNATDNTITNSVIQWCGMYGQGDDISQYKYHNAEGVYIGTSPASTTQPMYANDTSSGNIVSNSLIHTFGSECVDFKENAHDNLLIHGECMGNDEPVDFGGSNVEFRGDHNVVEDTIISDSRGYNVKLKSDNASYDKGGNSIRFSALNNSAGAAILNNLTTATLGEICGNTFINNAAPLEGNSVGDPTQACVAPRTDIEPPTVAITSPSNNATVSGTITLKADASDNAGVTKVEFLVNDGLIGTVTAAPYEQPWTAPTTAGTFTITAKAYDAKGHVAQSQITVSKGADVIIPSPPTNVTGQAVSPTEAKISWNAATDNVAIVSYDVYRNGSKIANTASLSYSDVGLSASTSYNYYLKAVDGAGNQSPASSSINVATPAPPSVQGVSFEAESGVLTSPMVAYADSTAQGGKYIAQTSGTSTGKATYTFNVPTAGNYKMIGRVIAPSTSSNSFYYAFDSGSQLAWELPSDAKTWTWTPATSGPTQYLAAGSHKLIISKKENSTKLDAVTLTLDTTTTTPSSITATSLFEAEAGTASGGMTVTPDSTASGGKYVLAKTTGTVTYSINVATKATYMIAGWIKAPNASSDSLNVKIDSGSYLNWDLQDPTTKWTYDATSNPTFSLTAGVHTLTLQYREPNAAVDRLVFVKQ